MQILLVSSLFVIAGVLGQVSSQGPSSNLPARTQQRSDAGIDVGASAARPDPSPRRICPNMPRARTVEIKEANPEVNKQQHKAMRDLLIKEIQVPNTTILLGPNVVIDFSEGPDNPVPLSFGPCVTLTSTTIFRPTNDPFPTRSTNRSNGVAAQPLAGNSIIFEPSPARTPHSLGPLLKFGPHRSKKEVFLSVSCPAEFQPNDNVRISGFRIHGPSFGQQSVEDIGIQVFRCLNVEISNMEIAGWGGQAIQILDDPAAGPGQEQPNNWPGDRIGRPEQIRIFNNYIHHNQHPSLFDRWDCSLIIFCKPHFHAAGYGVDVHDGAWARIYQNVFDSNRHAIAASGVMGGYEALRNLVLKGGGYHKAGFHTHEFDIHGTGDNGFGGQAGIQTWYVNNSFQYRRGPAIEVRGRPRVAVYIHDNVFPHEGLEDDWGDDAIHVENRNDLDVIKIGSNNAINFDSYGRYGVCDFDGDAIDDLFLATGQTWWFSSYGEFQWSYLSARTERLNQVRLGYFDNDNRCDVLTESDGEWVFASGGTGPWRSIGAFGVPLSEVVFGQFDPRIRDQRPGVTRRTTDAFRRLPNGQWQVTSLSAPAWQDVGSSGFPMNKLRFGDFTGDGVTDVLAVQGGRWSISESARGSWQRLNQYLADDVSSLFIADLNNNNKDDLIRLDRTRNTSGYTIDETFTWWVSDDGRSRWRKLKTHTFISWTNIGMVPTFAYAGRFGAKPGGGVLLIDHNRVGQFYSEAEIAPGVSPSWTSVFQY